jgi:8-oxo-dGTP diphosphatase
MLKGVDYPGVCVVYYCHDGQGNVLFARRSQNSRDEQGIWDIGGGGVDFGETIENTIKKEIMEEYCAKVLEFEFLGFRDVHRTHNGVKTHWIALDYKVLIDPNGVKIGEPHKFDDIGWFKWGSFPTPQHSQFPEFLNKYQEKLK